MSAFKAGDRVEIVGPAYGGSRSLIGQTYQIEDIDKVTRFYKIGAYLFIDDCLRLVPAFKAGDMVRVLSGETEGRTGEIECIWHSEGRPDNYEMGEWCYEADELELLPARVPKAGEVWKVHNCPCLIAHDDKTLVTVVLEVARVYTGVGLVDAQRFEAIGATFLAPDLAAYFKDRPC